MVVNNVSFTGLKQTKKGNLYEKKNTGKRIGTAVGLIGGTALSLHPSAQIGSALASAELAARKLPVHPSIILCAGILAVTLLLRGLGAIPDYFANKKRIAKADKMAEEK